jgi:mono/diheme cytochrome c family protein
MTRGPGLGHVATIVIVVVALAGVTACRQDMQDQPRYKPLAASTFFADGTSARLPVDDTVARSEMNADTLLETGKVNGVLVDEFPFPVTKAVLDRGQERFDIFCSPCHGRLGDGRGIVPLRGFRRPPPSYHDDRLRAMPVGHFIDVMTNGFGAMQDYRAQVPVRDRWAIAAYIRALQLSEHAVVADLDPADRAALSAPAAGQPAREEPHR